MAKGENIPPASRSFRRVPQVGDGCRRRARIGDERRTLESPAPVADG
jgi:hypothetical protein